MLDFELYNPTRMVFGRGKENEAGQLARAAGGSRILVHFGGGSVVRSGLLDRVLRSLAAAGAVCFQLGGVQPNPLDQTVYAGIEICRRENIDLVLGIGGGSVLDSAKAIAIGALYSGDFWDFYSYKLKPAQRLKLGVIITLPGTGTDSSNSSVIVRSADRMKRGLRSDLNRPDFAIINPELGKDLPTWQVACGASDILSHIFERYFTNTAAVDLTDRLCEAVILAVLRAAPAAVADPADYANMATLFWAASVAHNGHLGVGREEDWSAHALDHEIGGRYNTAHGAGLAAIYPAWLQYHLPHRPGRLGQLGRRVFAATAELDLEAGREGIRRLAGFYRSLGLPVSLRELGVSPDVLPELAARAKRNPDGTCGHFLPLTGDDILAIYRLAYDWSPETLNR